MAKIGSVDPELSLLKSLFLKKVEINASRTLAHGACMLRGLKNINK